MIKYEDLATTFSAKLPRSNALLARASEVLVSFVTTGPYRAPANVSFVKRAEGSKVWDIDGNEYLDVTMGYGPLHLLGDNSWFMPYMGDKPFRHARDGHDENHVMRNIILCNYLRYMGVYFPDMHTGFFSASHTLADADFFVDKCKSALLDMRAQALI